MNEFKIGDRVMVPGTVKESGVYGLPNIVKVQTDDGISVMVRNKSLHPVPYTEPELKPGDVVASADESDRSTWVVAAWATLFLCLRVADGTWSDAAAWTRQELPDHIRVVGNLGDLLGGDR